MGLLINTRTKNESMHRRKLRIKNQLPFENGNKFEITYWKFSDTFLSWLPADA